MYKYVYHLHISPCLLDAMLHDHNSNYCKITTGGNIFKIIGQTDGRNGGQHFQDNWADRRTE